MAIARREGSRPTHNGTAIEAAVLMRVDPWLSETRGEIREYRYEYLVPLGELAAGPVEGDVVVDGAVTYDVTANGSLEHGLWRAPLRQREA
jgi:hypothetical protein